MRSAFIFYMLVFVFSVANSRQNIFPPKDIAKPKADTTEFGVFGYVPEIDAVIPKNRRSYLERNLEPDSILKNTVPAGCYTVNAVIIIDIEGTIADVVIQNDPGHGLGQWIKKVMEGYKGKWIPAQRNGRPVKSYRVQPVIIFIEEDDEKKCADSLPEKFML